jgi:hypothetical protein
MLGGVGLTAIYAAMTLASIIGVGALLFAFTPYRLKIERRGPASYRLRIEKSVTPRRERWSKANATLLAVCGVVVTGGAHLTISAPTNGAAKGPPASNPAPGQSPRRSPSKIGACQSFGDGSGHGRIQITDPHAYANVHERFHIRGFAAPRPGQVAWLLVCVADKWQVLSDQPLRKGKGFFVSPPIYTDGADKGGIYQDCVVLVTPPGAHELSQVAKGYPADYIARPQGIEQHQCIDLRYWPPPPR